jgi:hypothetical protein
MWNACAWESLKFAYKKKTLSKKKEKREEK